MKHIFGRKDVQMFIYGLYNAKKCGEFREMCFKMKRFDAKKEFAVKDIVRKKTNVF